MPIRDLFRARVKDQGERPTCVAFAVSALHELWCDVLCGNKPGIALDLSEGFLFYGCKQRDGLRRAKGTTVEAAANWLGKEGQCLEELHPYLANASLLAVPSQAAFADGKARTLAALKQMPVNAGEVTKALGNGVPVVAVVRVFRSAHMPDSRGNLEEKGDSLGLHAVLLVDSEADDLIFLNSWGSEWGDGGFGRISPPYFSRHVRQVWSLDVTKGEQKQ